MKFCRSFGKEQKQGTDVIKKSIRTNLELFTNGNQAKQKKSKSKKL